MSVMFIGHVWAFSTSHVTVDVYNCYSTPYICVEISQEVVPKRIVEMEEAIAKHDFPSFARLACADSNQFHAVCLDTLPPIFYMNDTSHRQASTPFQF